MAPSIVTKNTGVKNKPKNVTPNIPEYTAMPIACRISLPGTDRRHQGHHAHEERK